MTHTQTKLGEHGISCRINSVRPECLFSNQMVGGSNPSSGSTEADPVHPGDLGRLETPLSDLFQQAAAQFLTPLPCNWQHTRF